MTLSYIPLFAITYFFWWVKPKDVLTPSVVDLPDMLPGQQTTFESMAVSHVFDDEGIGKQDSLWTFWYLTTRVFEKEAEDKAAQEAQQKASWEAEQKAASQEAKQAVRENERGENLKEKSSVCLPGEFKIPAKETVVAYWDPELYHSRFLWPITCPSGTSFGALHLISWNTEFPTPVEQWLWRAAALTSTVSMLIFMQFEKVIF